MAQARQVDETFLPRCQYLAQLSDNPRGVFAPHHHEPQARIFLQKWSYRLRQGVHTFQPTHTAEKKHVFFPCKMLVVDSRIFLRLVQFQEGGGMKHVDRQAQRPVNGTGDPIAGRIPKVRFPDRSQLHPLAPESIPSRLRAGSLTPPRREQRKAYNMGQAQRLRQAQSRGHEVAGLHHIERLLAMPLLERPRQCTGAPVGIGGHRPPSAGQLFRQAVTHPPRPGPGRGDAMDEHPTVIKGFLPITDHKHLDAMTSHHQGSANTVQIIGQTSVEFLLRGELGGQKRDAQRGTLSCGDALAVGRHVRGETGRTRWRRCFTRRPSQRTRRSIDCHPRQIASSAADSTPRSHQARFQRLENFKLRASASRSLVDPRLRTWNSPRTRSPL